MDPDPTSYDLSYYLIRGSVDVVAVGILLGITTIYTFYI